MLGRRHDPCTAEEHTGQRTTLLRPWNGRALVARCEASGQKPYTPPTGFYRMPLISMGGRKPASQSCGIPRSKGGFSTAQSLFFWRLSERMCVESELWNFACQHSPQLGQDSAWLPFEDLERFVASGRTISNASRLMQEYPNDICFLWRQMFGTDDKAFVRIRERPSGAVIDRVCWCSESPIIPRTYALYHLGKLHCSEHPWDSSDEQVPLNSECRHWHKLWISWERPSKLARNTGVHDIEFFRDLFGKRTSRKQWSVDAPGVALPLRVYRERWWNSEMMGGNCWSTVFDEGWYARIISSLCRAAHVDVDSDAIQIECTLFDLESRQLQLGDVLICTTADESSLSESLAQLPVWSTSPIVWRLTTNEIAQWGPLPAPNRGSNWLSIWTGHDLLPLVCRLGRHAYEPCSHHLLPDREFLPRSPMTLEQKNHFLKRFPLPDRVLVTTGVNINPVHATTSDQIAPESNQHSSA